MHDSQRSTGPFPGEPGGPGNAARAVAGGAPAHPRSGPPRHPSSIDDAPHRARSGWPGSVASEPDNTPDIRIEVPEGEAHPPGWRDRTDEVASMLWLGVALGWFAGLATGGVLWLVVEGLR